jgi:hypothetical protein
MARLRFLVRAANVGHLPLIMVWGFCNFLQEKKQDPQQAAGPVIRRCTKEIEYSCHSERSAAEVKNLNGKKKRDSSLSSE